MTVRRPVARRRSLRVVGWVRRSIHLLTFFCEIIPISPMPKSPNLRCPICKKAVKSTDLDYPFCSERCRTIDLGKWASGQYVISSPVKDIADEFDVQSDAGRSEDDE